MDYFWVIFSETLKNIPAVVIFPPPGSWEAFWLRFEQLGKISNLWRNIHRWHPLHSSQQRLCIDKNFINTTSSTLSLLSPDIEDQILFSSEGHENWNYVVVGTKEDREVMIASMMMETPDWRLELDMDILQQSGGHKRLPLHHPVWDPPSNPWYISQSYPPPLATAVMHFPLILPALYIFIMIIKLYGLVYIRA